jgi:hypothetical protein
MSELSTRFAAVEFHATYTAYLPGKVFSPQPERRAPDQQKQVARYSVKTIAGLQLGYQRI